MDKARVLTPAEGLMPRCPPSSAVATPEKSSDASFLYAPREYSDQTAEDPLNTQASSPVLKQAPTPRIVSLVEPKHRFSGFSSRVCTASDDHTLSSEEIALEEGQLEAENVTVQTSLGNDEATGRTPTSVWGDTPSRSATELTPPAKAHNGIRKSSLEPVSGKAAFNHSPPLSKRSRFMHPAPWRKRWLTGLWEHFWTPLGVLSAIYALTIFAWGTALFVIIMGWTSLPLFVRFQWVEYCSQVLTALFAITGLGFIPWRARDTYHIMIVADYARLARVRESRQILTKVFGPQPPNEMSKMPPSTAFERALLQRQESTVILALTERERRHLRKSVRVLAKSKTWFKPLGNLSHKASSLRLVVVIILLNDLNSVFQCVLCGFMWGVDPMKRPLWVVAMAVCGALLSTSLSGLLIAIGTWWSRKPAFEAHEAFEEWSQSAFTGNKGERVGA